MTDITDAFALIQQEETDRRSAASENIMTKVGGTNNALYNRLNQIFRFKFLGVFAPIAGGEDGVFTDIWPFQIVGISGYLKATGTAGTTNFDIHRITSGGGDVGSILSGTIDVANTAADGVIFYKNLLDASSNIPAGVTIPTVNTTLFDAGDTLRLDVDNAATFAENASIAIHYRART